MTQRGGFGERMTDNFHLKRFSKNLFLFVVDKKPQPFGFCKCGCGKKTSIAPRNHKSSGWVKGQPLNLLLGHSLRKKEKRLLLRKTCLIWKAGKNDRGYGCVGRTYIHILMYRKYVGKIKEGFELDHLCRNPSCANPRHLDPVTHAENCRRGGIAKLTAPQVEEIKKMRASGSLQREIASKFSIHGAHVSRILSGKRW